MFVEKKNKYESTLITFDCVTIIKLQSQGNPTKKDAIQN